MKKKGSIFIPGLEELISRNAEAGRITFSTDIPTTIQGSEVIFIAVGTPQDSDGSADLRYVLSVAAEIGKHMNGPKIIVNKSAALFVFGTNKIRGRLDWLC